MGTLKKKKTFLFCVGVYNVVLVSDGQQRDSAITYNISILPQTPLPLRHFWLVTAVNVMLFVETLNKF